GSGSFIHATLASKEKVVLNVGAGVSIEKNAAEAKDILKVRKAEVLEGSKKLNEVLAKIDQEMQKIQAIMQQYEEGAEHQHQHEHGHAPGSDIVV
ncbi:MAG: prefoldin subunit alpha, partial [Methanothrix sp.]|nr:prefoldin subunit alpha [Methanothrix sp.]